MRTPLYPSRSWIRPWTLSMSSIKTVSLHVLSCLMTRANASEEDNARIGVQNNLVSTLTVMYGVCAIITSLQIRLSVGLEESEDLVTDLKQALEVIFNTSSVYLEDSVFLLISGCTVLIAEPPLVLLCWFVFLYYLPMKLCTHVHHPLFYNP